MPPRRRYLEVAEQRGPAQQSGSTGAKPAGPPATAGAHCHPQGAAFGTVSTNPFSDIVIVLLWRDEADVGFAIRSPPAQATKYSPMDQRVVPRAPALVM